MFASILFFIFSFLILASALLVITSKNPVNSVIFLIFSFFNAAGIFLIAGAEFLALIMLIVYVGAVAVLFLFVVMMLNVAEQKGQWFSSRWDGGTHIPVGLLVSLIIFFELIIVIGGWKYKPDLLNSLSINISNEVTNTRSIGNVLYVFEKDTISAVTGDLGVDNFQRDAASREGVGCLSFHTIQEVEGALFFLARRGPANRNEPRMRIAFF